jgi:hypothetical protein
VLVCVDVDVVLAVSVMNGADEVNEVDMMVLVSDGSDRG